MNPAYNLPPYFSRIHSNIIFPYTPRSSEWSLPFKFSNQNFVCISYLFICVLHALSISSFSGIALGYGLDDRGFESWQGPGIFLFTIVSRPALWLTQPPIQWVRGTLSLGVKRPGCGADHSPPSSAEVKNEWSCSPSPICLHGMVLSWSRVTTLP
jgi:hypothetical protein